MTVLVTGGAGYIGSQMVHELADAGERVVVLDNLSTGHRWAVAESVPLIVGETGDQPLVTRLIREHDVEAIIHFAASIVVPDSVRDPLAITATTPPIRAPDRMRGQERRAAFHLFLDRRGLRQSGDHSGAGRCADAADLAVRLVEADDGNHAARRQRCAWPDACDLCAISTSPAPIRECRTGQSSPTATHLIKVAAETALGLRPKLEVFGTDYPTPDGTCIRDYIHVGDLARAHSDALRHLRSGGPSLTLNCGYGHGFSVLEVIETVKRVSGVDFKVEYAPRAAGRPGAARGGERTGPRHARLATAFRRSFDHRQPCARLGTRTHDLATRFAQLHSAAAALTIALKSA